MELWFRMAYRTLIREERIRTALRPGNRRYPNSKGVLEGEICKARILSHPGDEEKNLPPKFDDFERLIQIEEVTVKPLCGFTSGELKECSPDCRTPELAKYHLGLIYNREIQDNEIISMIRFRFIGNDGAGERE